ncbi:hypothetical protein ISCGN_017934 [Ixodes scapularis]
MCTGFGSSSTGPKRVKHKVGAEVHGARRLNPRDDDASLLTPKSNGPAPRTFGSNFVFDETHERESSGAFCVLVIAMDPNVLRVAPPQQHGETTSSSSPATTRNPAVTPRAPGGRSVLP